MRHSCSTACFGVGCIEWILTHAQMMECRPYSSIKCLDSVALCRNGQLQLNLSNRITNWCLLKSSQSFPIPWQQAWSQQSTLHQSISSFCKIQATNKQQHLRSYGGWFSSTIGVLSFFWYKEHCHVPFSSACIDFIPLSDPLPVN